MKSKTHRIGINVSKRLLHDYVKPHAKKIALAAICMVVTAGSTAMMAALIKPIINKIFIEHDSNLIIYLCSGVIIISIVKGISSFFHSFIMKSVGQRITIDLQLALYKHLLDADISLFSGTSSGHLVSRFSNDIYLIRKNLTNVLVGFAKETVTLIFLVGVMFYMNWQLALIAFTIFPIAIYPVLRLGRRMHKVSHCTQEELEGFTGKLDDTFQGVRIVKAYCREEHEVKIASTVVESIYKLYVRAARIESLASPFMETLSGLIIAAVIWYGGNELAEGTTTPGDFFAFIAAMLMAYKPMKSLANINTNMQEGLAAVKRIFSVLDIVPNVQDKPDAYELSAGNAGVELKNIHFSYNSDNKAISGISINVPEGKRIALVGKSGGGKSTIMSLILRFYDTDKGEVIVGGKNIKDITLSSLRTKIAVVNQEATLFDDTIRNNILYGKQNATEEEMIEAAKAASAHEFIIEQPDGYDTNIGQHGLKLSGGQRQRIAIARAMLKNAPILLLDEATSALDTVSEREVQKALNKLMENRTTIVIAHRLSTIINADVIYVIEEGLVKEYGSHDELLNIGGAYKKLYSRQFIRSV